MGEQLLVRIDFAAALHGCGLCRAKRFGIADQHDRERAGSEVPQYRGVKLGRREVRQAGREVANDAVTGGFAADQANDYRGHDHDDQGRGYTWRPAAEQQHGRKAEQAGQHRGKRSVGQMLKHGPKLGEEVAGGAADTQEVRHLSDDGHQDKALDESAHHGRGYKGCHPAHAQRAEQQEKCANQNGEGRRERIEARGSRRCDGSDGQRGNQAGGRVRPDHEHTRGAEHRVDNQGRDDRVEAHNGWHADYAGIGHALWHHDCPDCKSRKDIRHQPIPPVGRKPIDDGQQLSRDRGKTGRDRHDRRVRMRIASRT
jgi:hypothetical protein